MLLRIVGFGICIRDYYQVITQHHLVLFRTIVVNDWTMYIFPLTTPVVVEVAIAIIINKKNEIDRMKQL